MSTYSDEVAEHRLAEMSDMDRLWWSQFGNPVELACRVSSIIVVGLLVWLYDGRPLGPIWVLSYLIPLAICYAALRPVGPKTPMAGPVGLASYVTMAVAYASLPIYLLTSPDPVLVFSGSFGVIILGAFTLMREEPPAIVPPIDIAIGWVAIAVVAATQIPAAGSVVAQIVMGLLCIVAGGYYTRALISVREARVDLRKAAQRAQRDKQMEAIGKLSGGIAHDFNNILTALKGSLELYHEVPAGPERDALVDEANKAGARASFVVAQLLAFARRAPISPRPLSVDTVIDDAVVAARRGLPDAIPVETRQPEQPLHVMADQDGLQAALLALIQNAQDAMGPSGTLVLAADLSHGPAPDACCTIVDDPTGAHLSFSVADDGPGMTPAALERATEPFFTTKMVGKGSGLGLSMAAGFAEQSGGVLRIKSSERGTIVSLHLPIATVGL